MAWHNTEDREWEARQLPNARFPQSNNLIPSVSRKDRSTTACSDVVLAELFFRTTLLWGQDVAEFSEEFSANGKVETC